MTRALGRLPHSPEAVAAAPRLTNHYALSAPSPTLDRSAINYIPQERHNATLPTCTIAGLINGALAVEAINTNGALKIADDCELAMYGLCSPCAPTEAAIADTDGLEMLAVLRRQARDGFDIGAVAPLTGYFGTVPLDRGSLATVMARLGFVYLGVELAQADLTAEPPAVWDAGTPDPTLGHCMVAWSYTGLGDTDLVTVATWGMLQCLTWRGLEARLREAYAILLPGIEGPDINVAALALENEKWLAG